MISKLQLDQSVSLQNSLIHNSPIPLLPLPSDLPNYWSESCQEPPQKLSKNQ
jgi:hypothetical protein